MPHSSSVKLRFGPYRTPRFEYGQKVLCAIRGTVGIIGTSDARIPWPVALCGSRRTPVLYKSLVKAVRRETREAVCYGWGTSKWVVQNWRRALGVGHENEGSRLRRREHGRSKTGQKAVRAMLRKAHTPENHDKISATKTGVQSPPHVAKLLRRMRLGKPHTAATRRKMSRMHKRLNHDPPNGRRWEPWEEQLVRELSPAAAAKKTGRTRAAIYERRRILKSSDRGTRRQQKRIVRSA